MDQVPTPGVPLERPSRQVQHQQQVRTAAAVAGCAPQVSGFRNIRKPKLDAVAPSVVVSPAAAAAATADNGAP